MSINTDYLQLYMSNPLTEGESTFNIETMLNNNWKKIDASAKGKANIPVINSKDLLINSTNSQVVATYTPSNDGNFEIKTYLFRN